jgi:hypothetical protein
VPSDAPSRARRPAIATWLVAMALVGVGAAVFLDRGVARGLRDSGDLLVPYLGARAWIAGASPYDTATLDGLRRQSGIGDTPNWRVTPPLYPPASLVVLSPLALLPWPVARVVWLVTSIVVVAAALAVVWRKLGRGPLAEAACLAGLVLLLAPLHTGLAKGNPAVVAAGLVWLAVASGRHPGRWGPALAGMAVALKPQIGAPFLLLLAARWPRRATGLAIGGAAALLVVGMFRLEIAGTDWVAAWLDQTSRAFGPGGPNDASVENDLRYQLLNLQWLLAEWTGVRTARLDLATWVLAGAAFLWLLGRRTSGAPRDLLDTAAALSPVVLLASYHRTYDAVLLALPIAWAAANWTGPQGRHARLALLTLAAFLTPGAAALVVADAGGYLPGSISSAWWWTRLALPHQVWALLALSAVLFHARARAVAVTASSSAIESPARGSAMSGSPT